MSKETKTESDEKWIELQVRLPDEASWEQIREIEDEISKAAGEILENQGFKRKSHKRTVTADYSEN